MDEILRQVRTILRSMWRHRHLAMVVTWIAGAAGAITVMVIPDKYEATARIYVDTQSVLQPLMAGLAVQPNVEQQIMMLSRTLLSRPNMEKLVRMADLDLGMNKQQQDILLDSLSKQISVSGGSRDNLYNLAYRNASPDQAKRVIQALTSIFVEASLGDKRKDTDTAKKFIEDQIRGYEKKLEEAEARLKEFKLRNIELQTADGKSSVDRLGDIGGQLNAAKLALREAENSRDALKKQLAGEDAATTTEAAPPGDPASLTPELDSRIDAMKRNLDTLLQRYTEQHPDIVGSRRVLKELEDQRRQEIAARKKVASTNPALVVSSNPVFQKLKIALGENEATVASLRARVAEYESKVKESLKLAPQIESEFSQLNRDYEIHKQNFQSLVSRRESATMTGELGSQSGVADFRLIDPPRVDPKPVAPNRLVLLPGGLVAGLIAGLLASFVAAQVRPVFHDGRQLSEVTGIPLLGMVSISLTAADQRKARRSLLRFAAALAALVALYGVGLAVLYIKLQAPA